MDDAREATIQSFKVFGKRKKGHEVHHLVEKRFWEQLGFRNERHGERNIVGAEIDKKLHKKITKRLREQIGYEPGDGRTKGVDLQKIWKAHKQVYERYGLEKWSDRIWKEYFEDHGVIK